jgi:predicted TIM-barrel fold metal-dependent hydrolase
LIIDAHVHIGRHHVKPWHTADAVADLTSTARICGIDRLIVCSLGDREFLSFPTPEEFREGNDHVLEEMERFPDILLGYCYVSPLHPAESVDEIRRCVQDGPMVGIKLLTACKASDPAVDPILQEAARLGVPVLQHAWNNTTGNRPTESTPADVAAMAKRHPGATIQMAHLHGGNERGVQDVAPYPNILVDTSGSEAEAGMVEYAVQAIGADRIVFGSDAPGRDFSVQMGKVMGADITEEQRNLILGGNMARVLRLED